MSKIFTYIRKNLNNEKYTQEQEEAISNYVSKKKLQIYKNVEIVINTPKDEKNILQLLENCEKNSMIIVTNLNVFGRTIDTILEIVKFLLQNKIRIIVIEQNLEFFHLLDFHLFQKLAWMKIVYPPCKEYNLFDL